MNVSIEFIIVITALALLIGLTCIKIGYSYKNTTFTYIGVIAFICALLLVFIIYPNLVVPLSALSTVSLTIFASITLFIHWRQRQDSVNKEIGDRKRFVLDRIAEWLIQIDIIPMQNAVKLKSNENYELTRNVILEYCRLISESRYINSLIKEELRHDLYKDFLELANNLKIYVYIMSHNIGSTKLIEFVAPLDDNVFDDIRHKIDKGEDIGSLEAVSANLVYISCSLLFDKLATVRSSL